MTRLASAALLSLIAVAAPAAAQQVPAPTLTANAALLTVSAEGRTMQAPDIATFSAGVTNQAATASAALAANSADMTKVIAALKRIGIADRDIQTSDLSLNPIYAPQRPQPDGSMIAEQPRIVGYQAANTVTVRQRKLAEYGRVIDTLVAAGANQISGPGFAVENPDPATDAARAEAVTKARARAELYARAAGLKVARILSISESGGWSPPPAPMYRMSAKADAPVQAGEMALGVTVTVQFELAP